MWNIPELRFSHLLEVKEKTGINLSDFDQIMELDNVVQLAKVIKVLSPTDFEENYHGDNIQFASEQLFERVTDFFPFEKAQALKVAIGEVQKFYRKAAQKPKDSGELSSSLLGSSE